jgi:hypothetical protein
MVWLFHIKATHDMQKELLNSPTDGNILNNVSFASNSVTCFTKPDSNIIVDKRVLNNVIVSNYGFLTFSSRDSYDASLDILKDYDEIEMDAWEKSIGFSSAYTVFSNPQLYNEKPENNLNSLFEDDFLLRLLNKNGIIQIGQYVFKLEVNNYRVLEISSHYLSAHYDTFINGYFNPLVMNEFNTLDDRDVFDVLDKGIVGERIITTPISSSTESETGILYIPDPNSYTTGVYTSPIQRIYNNFNNDNSHVVLNPKGVRFIGNGKPVIVGGEDKPGTPEDPRKTEQIFTNKESFNYDVQGTDGFMYRAQVKASYQTALIYYSLVTVLNYRRRAMGGDAIDSWAKAYSKICFVVGPVFIGHSFIDYRSFCKYKSKGKADEQFPTVPHQNEGGAKNNTHELHWRPYESSRKLERYAMNIMFAFINQENFWKAVQVSITKT